MVIGEVARQDAPQVPFAEHENMIQALAADRADEPLREGVLPRIVGCREDFCDAHALHSVLELLAVDAVAIAEEIGRRGVVREGLHDLLGRPLRGGVLGHVEVDDAAAIVGQRYEDEEHSQARAGDREEVDGDQVPDVVGKERPPGLGRRGAPLGERRETVRSATLIPSLRSSPWMRGAPHRGFAVAMRVTRALISALTGGRPLLMRPESWVQYSRKRRRCHRRTVSGATMINACLQPPRRWPARPKRGDRSCAAWAGYAAPVHGELLAQGEVLQGEVVVAAEEGRATDEAGGGGA